MLVMERYEHSVYIPTIVKLMLLPLVVFGRGIPVKMKIRIIYKSNMLLTDWAVIMMGVKIDV